MISIYAFSLFLWIYLAAQAPTQGVPNKIKTASRTINETHVTLTVEYEGDLTEAEVFWRPSKGQTPTSFTVGNGVTKLEYERGDVPSDLFLDLGSPTEHIVGLMWNLWGSDDRTVTLNYVLSAVSPGAHVTIPVEKPETVTVTSDANPELPDDISVLGEYRNDSGQVVTEENLPFMVVSTRTEEDKTVTDFTFEEGTKEGHYFYWRWAMIRDYEHSPIVLVEEFVDVKAHEQGKDVSFPNFLVKFWSA